jgi:hypothetical protein
VVGLLEGFCEGYVDGWGREELEQEKKKQENKRKKRRKEESGEKLELAKNNARNKRARGGETYLE